MECLHCPITFQLFQNPVRASDRVTYERDAIIDWLKRNSTSPESGDVLLIDDLNPNERVRQAVKRFQDECKTRKYQYNLDGDIRQHPTNGYHRGLHTIFDASWEFNGPPISLIELEGLITTRKASYYNQKTSHPYIARIYGIIQQNRSLLLVQESTPIGDLASLLPTINLESTKTLKVIFSQIIEAILFCQIVHGNLSCLSVLAYRIDNTIPDNTLVKLTNFGFL